MHLSELKRKPLAELLIFAEELAIENASNLRRQDMLFAILKVLAEKDTSIEGDGVLEILQDGFGFLRSAQANYLPAPMIFMSRPARFAASDYAQAIRLKAPSVAPKTASATSPC